MKKELEKILKQYIELFCEKQDMRFEFAVLGDYLDVICFDYDMFINMSDIIYDIENKVPKGVIKEWYYYTLDTDHSFNYRSYVINFKN